MELDIKNTAELNLDNFCKYLIEEMQKYMTLSIDDRQLERFNYYLNNDNKFIRFRNGKVGYISCREILINSTYNLVVKKINMEYIIKIDDNAYIYNTNAKFIDVVGLINYGNLNLAPYPIYDNMMNEFAENIQDLWEEYTKGA